jgi:phenylacetic acid degradation operon negative regulatory protein
MRLTMRPSLTRAAGVDSHLSSLLAEIRPLNARSVIASTLLGMEAGRLPVERLVSAGALFGIAEGAIRTALWRMVAAGELITDDGTYRLAGSLLARRRRMGADSIARRRSWDGTWEIVVVDAERRSAAARQELRSAAAALHLAELRDGVWMRPDNLDPKRLPHEQATVDAQCLRFTGASGTAALASRLFEPAAWAARAASLLDALDGAALPSRDLGPGDLVAGFRLSIAVVRHLDRDPLLPDELLPSAWPGDDLRRSYLAYHAGFSRRFTAWLRDAEDLPRGD